MAVTTPNVWQTVRNVIWLFFGVVCLLIALIIWASQSKKSGVELIEVEQQAQEALRPVNSEKVGLDSNLGTLQDEVPPLVVKQRVLKTDNHEAEFRGSKFLSERQKSWTLQLMKVREEDIVRSYLEKREDRKNFQYFRLESEGEGEQFVLTYGSFKDAKDALTKTTKINFQLPEGVKLSPEKFSTYIPFVNELGADELSSGLKLKTVNLTKVALPAIIERPQIPTSSSTNTSNLDAGTTTTIRQTDPTTQQQKVRTETSRVPTQQPSSQEQRSTPAKPHNNDSQVVDPF